MYYNMDDPWKHYAKKPVKKDHINCMINFIEKSRMGKCTETEKLVVARAGGGLGERLLIGTEWWKYSG